MQIPRTMARRYLFIAVTALCTFVNIDVQAQDYPNKPLRIVVPSAPGGTADFITRLVAQRFTDAWGQQVVVDFRGGAAGNVGTEIAARAPADGYTLLVAATSHAPEVKERIAAVGIEPVGSTPREFAVYLNSETVKWAKVIKQSRATAD